MKTGGQVAIIGGGLTIAGGIAAMIYAINAVFNNDNSSPEAANFLLITGTAATITGLGIMTHAKIKKNRIVNEYNGMVRGKNKPVTLYLKPGINRISFALKF